MKNTFLLLAILSFSCACNTSQSKLKKTDTQYSVSAIQQAGKTPADLRTHEQTEMLEKLTKLVSDNLMVENNHLVLKLTEKDFVKNNISKEVYSLIQKEVVINNKYIDSLHIDANQMLKDSRWIKQH
ncbi:hypothetical protein [Siphonobacter sp. SORGH_AS_1065]|uniref:hypothetical protein n=1 Tax=Siphonobacter sp. SORGH_AS_1065 TaxID=3041795 RepID=UPI0027830AFF|nr:hypothetical protein [Siphonobacter sp. SORGH_AS_1065]MDQ1089948.1 hypothetical protein [Siphonobacter sp. SORGH_AS_1065]